MKSHRATIRPYTIDVPESILTDLNQRLRNTRWSQSPDLGWGGGIDGNYLTEIDHIAYILLWTRQGPAPLPLILTNGYPDSFYRFREANLAAIAGPLVKAAIGCIELLRDELPVPA